MTSELAKKPSMPMILASLDADAFKVILAASKGALEELKGYHAKSWDLSKPDYDLRTPLHLASAEGHIETVKFLVETVKTDVNAEDRWGGTPLSDATRHKHVAVARYLVSKGANKNTLKSLQPEFFEAAREGDLEAVSRLIKSGVDVNAFDYDSRTAMHRAALTGQTEVVDHLIQNGAFVNVVDRWGNTPLQDANRGQHNTVKDLISRSGSLQTKNIDTIKGTPKFWASLQELIVTICDDMKFSYGAVWITNEKDKNLRCPGLWYALSDDLNALAEYHSKLATTLPYGKGAVGFSVDKPEAVWISEQKDIERYTLEECKDASVGIIVKFENLLCVPIRYGDRILAVLELRDLKPRTAQTEIVGKIRALANHTITSTLLSSSDSTVSFGSGHSDQMKIVYNLVLRLGSYSEVVTEKEVNYFFNKLGFPAYYFVINSPHTIANHVVALITAKQYAKLTGGNIRYAREEANHALYITTTHSKTIERQIEIKYLGTGYVKSAKPTNGLAPSVRFFLSEATIDGAPTSPRVGLYIVEKHAYLNPKVEEGETSLKRVATGAFLRDKGTDSQKTYEDVIKEAIGKMCPVVTRSNIEEVNLHKGTVPVTIAFPAGFTHSLFSSVSILLELNGLTARSKFVENFSNDISVYMLYIECEDESSLPAVDNFMTQVNFLFILPRTSLFPLLEGGQLQPEEVVYAYAGWKFSYHFLNKQSDEFKLLWDELSDKPTYKDRLIRLRKRIRSEAATESRCKQAIFNNVGLIKELYADFEHHFKPRANGETPPKPVWNDEICTKINREVGDVLDREILTAFLTLNSHLQITNFYKRNKAALSLRFEPSFLENDYPEVPYAVFQFIGAEFRGFHIRFSDIARGGIRMIKSRNEHQFLRNVEKVFDENYNLALTQFKKNKDIPEGGSKGTILLSMAHQDKATVAFRKYIDSILDILLAESDGDEDIVNHYDKIEYVFCGPDEGTADLMDWAALHAKSRGYRYWTAFTTGKSESLGGIPHDRYGMTTRSVRQYVLGIMRKKGIKAQDQLKVQTGGPDGDLGSNEILLSEDKTKVIIDGAGVLYDPQGINKEEIVRLAKARQMVDHFDRSKLTKDGFLVLLADKDVTLPDGTKVHSGMTLRNTFHLTKYAACDFFVPCGGRPESININNVSKVLTGNNGKPLFSNIVEGANLFLTQEARLKIEEQGIPVLKDASANKGGVTSSSMEVLAALALIDEEHQEHMCVKDGVAPKFYGDYVKETQKRIEDNARDEFECIWNEHQISGRPMCVLSDAVSAKINALNQTITESSLWSNPKTKQKVLEEAIPKLLLDLIGLDKVVERVPEAYIAALLSAHLASRYVYAYGLAPGEFSFYEFMQKYN